MIFQKYLVAVNIELIFSQHELTEGKLKYGKNYLFQNKVNMWHVFINNILFKRMTI